MEQGTFDKIKMTMGMPEAVIGSAAVVIGDEERMPLHRDGVFEGVETQDNPVSKIGSVTKMFVAAAAMSLDGDENVLFGIGDSVSSHNLDLPGDFNHNLEDITIRDLMSHKTGLPDFIMTDTFIDEMTNETDRHWTRQDQLAMVPQDRAEKQNGEYIHDYANTNYLILAEAMEKATGQSMSDIIKDRVLEPAELDNTYYYDPELQEEGQAPLVGRNENIDYDQVAYGMYEGENANRFKGNLDSGGMVSTPDDLATFARKLFEGEIDGISKERADTMLPDLDAGEVYGLGVAGQEVDGKISYGHMGAVPGAAATVQYFPEEGLSYAGVTTMAVETKPESERMHDRDLVAPDVEMATSIRERVVEHSNLQSALEKGNPLEGTDVTKGDKSAPVTDSSHENQRLPDM